MPPSTAIRSGLASGMRTSRGGASGLRLATAARLGTAQGGDARPMTSNKAAGYSSGQKGYFDPMNAVYIQHTCKWYYCSSESTKSLCMNLIYELW